MRNAALSLLAVVASVTCLAAEREITTPVAGPSPLRSYPPAVASDGTTFLTAWSSGDGIRGALFDTSGNRITSLDVLLLPVRPSWFDRWFSGIESDIAPDGSEYVVSWRYPGASAASSYIATARVSPAGMTSPTVVIEAGKPAYTSQIAVTTNRVGDAMTTVTELEQSLARARAYFNWEMQPMPSPPPQPTNVAATITATGSVVLRWQTGATATGGVAESVRADGLSSSIGVFPADRSFAIFNTLLGLVRVRSFNAGGLSDPVTVSVQVAPPRRRAA